MSMKTRIYESEITTSARFDSDYTYTMLDKNFHAEIDNLSPDKDYQINIEVKLSADSSAKVTVQQNLSTYTAISNKKSYPVNNSKPVTVDISADIGTQIAISIESSNNFAGTKRFALLAYLPRPEYESALLGKAILGAFRLPSSSKPSDGFILGTSVLGTAALASTITNNAWTNIISPGTSISVSRGVDFNGFTSRADIGTLTFTAYNALIPAASNIVRGVKVKLIDAATRRQLYAGMVDSIKITPAKDDTYTLQISCVDILASLGQARKSQATQTGGVTWTSAVKSILSDKYSYTVNSSRSDAPLIGSIVKDSNLIDYLDIYSATVGASWYASKTGKIIFTDTLDATPRLIITDTSITSESMPVVSPVEIDATFDTSTVISDLEVTNNSAVKDEEDVWQSQTKTLNVENVTLERAYGENSVSIETCAVSADALEKYLQTLLTNYASTQSVRQANFLLINDGVELAELYPLLEIEILDPVLINYRHSQSLAHIQRVTYQITPQQMTAQIELINHREE